MIYENVYMNDYWYNVLKEENDELTPINQQDILRAITWLLFCRFIETAGQSLYTSILFEVTYKCVIALEDAAFGTAASVIEWHCL